MKKFMRVCALVALMAYFFLQASHRPTSPTKPLLTITAGQLAQEYADNEAEAEQIFTGSVVKLSGLVQSVGSAGGDPAVVLEGASVHKSVVAVLDQPEVQKAASIQPGAAAVLFCVGAKIERGNVTLRGCRIVR